MIDKRSRIVVTLFWAGSLLAATAAAQDDRACLTPAGCPVAVVYDPAKKILVSATPLPILIPGDRVRVWLVDEWRKARHTGVWTCRWDTKEDCGFLGWSTCTIHHEQEHSMFGKLGEQIHLRADLVDDRQAVEMLANLTSAQPAPPVRRVTGRRKLQLVGSVSSSSPMPGRDCSPKTPPPTGAVWYRVQVSIQRADKF
jgi:hypothetical protein